jgi:two-component SAPR family response regulator
MANPGEPTQIVRFGEFELDLRTGELRTDCQHIILQEKPFQILTTLLERPGEMVTREELIKRLWPAGTFVDFDLSLNKAVNRLREALEDSAEQPRFIETFPSADTASSLPSLATARDWQRHHQLPRRKRVNTLPRLRPRFDGGSLRLPVSSPS